MLVIQDPTNEQSTFLLESLLEAFRSAEKVAGAFAFASSAGVRLFANDEAFQTVARRYAMDLVVGIDAVTNNLALDSLVQVTRDFPKVTIRAFLNPRPEALFHPKFCWVKNRKGGVLISGSGNLTEAGLLRNWEAYSVETLPPEGIAAVEATWNAWTQKHQASLLGLDHVDVRRRATANTVMAQEGDLPTLVAPAPASTAVVVPAAVVTMVPPQLLPNTAPVLVAEIPRASTRWSQANFDLDNYVNFFGAREGTRRLLVFRHVNDDGTMADYEKNRPPVTVKSRNFRFELAAATGIPYPDDGRPIGVFIRVGSRTFFYRLVMPDDAQYEAVRGLLERRAGPGHNLQRMRRERMTAEELRQEWPNAPFWNLPPEA